MCVFVDYKQRAHVITWKGCILKKNVYPAVRLINNVI